MKTDQINMADGIDSSHKMLTVMFADKESAENAYNELLERGYTMDNINVAMSDETHNTFFLDDVQITDSVSTAVHDAAVGGTIGATIVGVTAAAIAIGAGIILPGVGLVIAGPIAAGIAGAATGGITGGIIGALVGAGVPEAHARLYESGIHHGHIVISFHPHSDEEAAYFEKNWQEHMGTVIHDAELAHRT